MRNTLKDKRIYSATKDYYNVLSNPKESKRANQIALHITGRKRIKLIDEEKADVWAIRQNMTD